MKNRLLPSGFLAAFLGFSCILFTVRSMAGLPDSEHQRTRNHHRTWTSKVAPDDVIKVQQQIKQSGYKAALGLGLDWMPMGPDNVAGAARTVLFDNRDNTVSTIYTGGTSGGVWRSQNLGLTWHKMNTNTQEVLRVSSLVQTSGGTIYAGTGVSYCHEVGEVGSGVYRSTDGENFTVIPETSLDVDWITVSRLVIDPRNERIFAAAWGGLFYSDNGDNWTKVLSGYANDVEVGSDGTVLAVIDDSVYIARGGDLASLQLLSTGDSLMLPNTGVGWVQTAIAPSDPNIMYVTVARSDYFLMNVYRSSDKGNTWHVIFPNNPSFEPFAGDGCYANTLTVYPNDPDQVLLGGLNLWHGKKYDENGYFYWEMLSSEFANKESPYYLPSFHHDYVFRPGYPINFAVASDGGISFATITSTQISYQTSNRNLMISRFNSVCPNRFLKYAMGGGVNAGTQTLGYFYPSLVNSPSVGYQIWQYGYGIANEGGTGGLCTWSILNPNMAVFTNETPILTTDYLVRRQELSDLTYSNDFLARISNTNVDLIPICMWESFDFVYTQDSVKFYNRTDTIIPAGTLITATSLNNIPIVFPAPYDINPNDSLTIADPFANRFFISGTKSGATGVFMTKDALKMAQDPIWFMVFRVPAALATNDFISTMSISTDLNTLWLGSEHGNLYRVSNLILANDSATADLNSPTCIVSNELFQIPEFAGRNITSISIDPRDNAKVLIALDGWASPNMLFYTQNALDSFPTFTNVTGNLPEVPIYSTLIEMHDANRALVGTEYGIYATGNLSGPTPFWAPDYNNVGNIPVMKIAQQTTSHYLTQNLGAIYIATFGNGLWMDTTYLSPLGIEPGPESITDATTILIYPNPVQDKATLTFSAEGNNNHLFVYDITGRIVMTGSLGTLHKGIQKATIDVSSLQAGTYIIRINQFTGKFIKW
jgi:hypothetical protein